MRAVVVSILLLGCGSVQELPKDAGPIGPPTDAPADGAADARLDGGGATAPTITSLVPDWGSSTGGTHVTIHGKGFSAAGLEVRLGATKTTVTVVSDTELVLTTPAGPIAPVDLTATTPGGASAPARFRYLAPLYAADGQGGQVGNLYTVDPVTALAVTVGPISFAVTGLAISPDGILFGATTGGGPVAAVPTLIKIDPYTGAGTAIATLRTAANVSAGASDIAFVGATLHGWRAKTFMTIDTTTGIVTLSADALPGGQGCGIAALNGSIFLAPASANGKVYSVDATTGVASPIGTLNGPARTVGAMTFVGTTLFGSVSGVPATTTTPKGPATLATINPSTGAMLTVGNLRTSAAALNAIDAIAGIPAQ